MRAPERILEALDRNMTGPGHVRLLGGAAMILAYGMPRTTEDADLLLDDREVQALIDEAEFGIALENTNAELEPLGLYLTHIWGPEQQILTANWRAACRDVPLSFVSQHLSVSALGPLDLMLSKLCRADDGDLADIRFLIETQGIQRDTLQEALQSALVPPDFEEVFSDHAARALALFDQ